ncbi:MAG: hydantoinase/oxoprolinase family protein, partial [Alphaproteobacteria bacterium]|nr:hydantoinase/oxoprolinase family protein [Alphaproteobacteria bacterium]
MANAAAVGPAAPWRIGVDVGGTFTDMVLRDAAGASWVYKVPSVASDPSQGVLRALAAAAADHGLEMPALLRDCQLFVHGSTVATNTILERKGARVALLTSQGFRDSLEVRRGIRENMWDHRAPFPEVLVPRYLRFPVAGRIDRDGRELAPLAAADIAAAARAMPTDDVEAVAVALINSYRNPVHEEQAAASLAAEWDGRWVSLSSRISPIMGEYERTSTAVVNAYIAPKVVSYLQQLNGHLREQGLARPILLLQSNGGAVSVDQVAERPVNLVLSGPAAGVGALNLYRRGVGSDQLIAMEIGGTSCDVTLMTDGQVAVSDELIIDGYHLATPSVEIHTVGAGGGTIARVDEDGLLHVGPHGAGAEPGPACYGLGGEEPTITDAQMVLGRLRPGPYAGGSVTLDGALAHGAVEERIAGPLGIAVEAAAAGIIRLIEQNLLHAVERISLQRGHDPRRFTLVAAGGAGPMHAATVARALGCRRAYVPRQAGAFCALGMLHSDLRQDYLEMFFADLDAAEGDDLAAGFRRLAERAGAALAAEGFEGPAARIERELDLRYRGQLWSIRVALPAGEFDASAARRAFEAEHQRQYGHIQPDGTIEITALRVTGLGLIDWAEPLPPTAMTK